MKRPTRTPTLLFFALALPLCAQQRVPRADGRGFTFTPFESAQDHTGTVTSRLDAAAAAVSGVGGIVVIPATVGAGQPTSYPPSVSWLDLRSGTPTNPITDSDSRLPNLLLKRYDDTPVVTGEPDDLILPPMASVGRFDMITGSHSTTGNFAVIGQTYDRCTFDNSAFGVNLSAVNVGGYFTAFGCAGSVKGVTGLNTVAWYQARPKGTVDVSGTTVTWLTGSKFDSGWANVSIEFKDTAGAHSLYTVATVTDTDHLELTAAVPSPLVGASFRAGGAVFSYELDLANASGEDVDPGSITAYDGLGVISGHNNRPLTGILVGSTNAQNAWTNGVAIASFVNFGLIVAVPQSIWAVGADITAGASAQAIIAHGPIVATRGSSGLIQVKPTVVALGDPVVYGTNVAGDVIPWSILQDGGSNFMNVRFSPDNGATPGLTMQYSAPDAAHFTPSFDSPTAVELFGNDAAQTSVKWLIRQNGDAQFAEMMLNNLAGVGIRNVCAGVDGALSTSGCSVFPMVAPDASGYWIQTIHGGANYGLYYDAALGNLDIFVANAAVRFDGSGNIWTSGALTASALNPFISSTQYYGATQAINYISSIAPATATCVTGVNFVAQTVTTALCTTTISQTAYSANVRGGIVTTY